MRPELFTLPLIDWPIPSYGVMIAIGLLVAAYVAERRGPKVGLPKGTIYDFALISIIAGLVGARATAVLENLDYFRAQGLLSVFAIWEGGLTFYGGLILALAVLFFVARRRRLGRKGALEVVDLAASTMALSLGFGRLGCLLNGCCFGQPSTLPAPLALRYPVGSSPHIHALQREGWLEEDLAFSGQRLQAAGASLDLDGDFDTALSGLVEQGVLPGPEPLLATQLFEAAFCFALFAFLHFWLWPRRTAAGQSVIAFLLIYPVGRFLEEFVRGDNPDVLGPLTISQVITVVLLVLTLGWVAVRRRYPPGPPAWIDG